MKQRTQIEHDVFVQTDEHFMNILTKQTKTQQTRFNSWKHYGNMVIKKVKCSQNGGSRLSIKMLIVILK